MKFINDMRNYLVIMFSIIAVYGEHLAFASAPISVPPPDIIQSADGNVKIGVSRQYGGAIAYLKDNRIPDSSVANGNIIDYILVRNYGQ